MIDINLIRHNKELVVHKLSLRKEKIDLDEILSLDSQKRKLQTEIDQLRNKRNTISSEIAKIKIQNKPQPIEHLTLQVEEINKKLEILETQLSSIETTLENKLLYIPNLPDDTVPVGNSPEDNVVVSIFEGYVKENPLEQQKYSPHWEVGERLDILDFKTAAKISGSRFAMLKGLGAKLERALINFMLDEHIKNGYEEVWLPYLVTKQSITGTGQLPKFEEELYKSDKDELYLIPTAEVSLINIYRDKIFSEDELPRKFVSYSACFRREAGSYGKDTKGLIRNHQFNKIELVKFTHPETSDKELELLVKDASEILRKLNLTHRIVLLCSAELGFASAKTYDLEVWMPGEKRWREVSSCSNCKEFQSRRLNIKVKYTNGKKEFVHTLNGSGVAVGRTFACILETYQQEDGTLKIPEVLVPYMGCKTIP